MTPRHFQNMRTEFQISLQLSYFTVHVTAGVDKINTPPLKNHLSPPILAFRIQRVNTMK